MEIGLPSQLATLQALIEQTVGRINDSFTELDEFKKTFESTLCAKLEEQRTFLESFNESIAGLRDSINAGLAEDRRIRRKLEADFTDVVSRSGSGSICDAEGGREDEPTTNGQQSKAIRDSAWPLESDFRLAVEQSQSSIVVFRVTSTGLPAPDSSIPWDEVCIEVLNNDLPLFGPTSLSFMLETGSANQDGHDSIEGILEIHDAPRATVSAKYRGKHVDHSPQFVQLDGSSAISNGIKASLGDDDAINGHNHKSSTNYIESNVDPNNHGVSEANGDSIIHVEKSNGVRNLSVSFKSPARLTNGVKSSDPEKVQVTSPTRGSTWDDTNNTFVREEAPPFSLLDKNVRMLHVNDLTLNKSSGAKVIPQMVAQDNHLDRIYISDLGSNVIHKYKGWTYDGIWATNEPLVRPRNVMTLPNVRNPEKGRKKGLEVVILDSNGIHVFGSNGIKRKSFYEGRGSSFRGLAYNQEFGWVITCQVSGPVPEICLLDVHDPYDSELDEISWRVDQSFRNSFEKVRHVLVCDSFGNQVKTACKFLATYKNMVYTSDSEAARFYETNLSTGKTRVCQVPEAKLVTGIATDPSGIILVGSMRRFRSDVLLFDQNLNFLRTLDLEVNLASISSITFLGRELYLTDVKEGVVYCFIASSGSPKKILREESDRIFSELAEII